MKKRLIIALTPLLVAGMCTTADRQDFCREKLTIAVSAQPIGTPETAENKFDTEDTVNAVARQNGLVGQVCDAIPAPAR